MAISNEIDLREAPGGLNPHQQELLNAVSAYQYKRFIWIGGARGGKGVGAANALILWAIHRYHHQRGNNTYILAGASANSFAANNESYLIDAARWHGLTMRYRGGARPHYDLGGIIKFHLFGGGNKRSYALVRGLTADGCWIDEVTLCDRAFVEQCELRLTFAASPIILTSNADKPGHWLKTDWIDAERADTLVMQSGAADNQHLDLQRKEFLYSQNPNTASYKRYVLNQWANEEGLIFPIPDYAIVPNVPGYTGEVFVDPGTAGTTAALLVVKRPDGGHCIAGEYYWNGDRQGRITEAEHWQNIKAKGWKITRAYVDPAAASFHQMMMQVGDTPFPCDNRYQEGVTITNNLLYSGDLTISRDCVNLLAECGGLQWNAQESRPLPGPDHAADCMRYAAIQIKPPETWIYLR